MTDTNYESLMDNEVGSASVVDVGAKEDEEVEEVVAVTRGSGDDDNGGDEYDESSPRRSLLYVSIHESCSAHSECI